MTEADALEIVREGLIGPDSIPVRLREGSGLDGRVLEQLYEALDFLAGLYADASQVPKVLAMAFVDITSSMQASWSRYPDAEQDRIEDAANGLVERAWQIFDTWPGESADG